MADKKNIYSEDLLVAGWHNVGVLSAFIFLVFAVLYAIALAGSTYEIFPVAEGVFRTFYKGMILSGMAWFFLLAVSEMFVLRRKIANLEKELAESKNKIAEPEEQ